MWNKGREEVLVTRSNADEARNWVSNSQKKIGLVTRIVISYKARNRVSNCLRIVEQGKRKGQKGRK